jgi:2-oxoglutarate ferredoxin oxidoreductase subunit beta
MANGIFLEQGQPLVFGLNSEFGIRLDGYKPQLVDLEKGDFSKDDLWIHDEHDLFKAQILSRFFDDPNNKSGEYFPRPFGVIFNQERPTYEDMLHDQLNLAVEEKGSGNLDALLAGKTTWTIE